MVNCLLYPSNYRRNEPFKSAENNIIWREFFCFYFIPYWTIWLFETRHDWLCYHLIFILSFIQHETNIKTWNVNVNNYWLWRMILHLKLTICSLTPAIDRWWWHFENHLHLHIHLNKPFSFFFHIAFGGVSDVPYNWRQKNNATHLSPSIDFVINNSSCSKYIWIECVEIFVGKFPTFECAILILCLYGLCNGSGEFVS